MIDKISCERASELLPLYFGGGLHSRGRAEVMAHLAGCGSCRREAAKVFEVARACEKAFPDPDETFFDSAFEKLFSGDGPERKASAPDVIGEAAETLRGVFSLTRKTLAIARII